jgi:hypothetical protein
MSTTGFQLRLEVVYEDGYPDLSFARLLPLAERNSSDYPNILGFGFQNRTFTLRLQEARMLLARSRLIGEIQGAHMKLYAITSNPRPVFQSLLPRTGSPLLFALGFPRIVFAALVSLAKVSPGPHVARFKITEKT